MPVGLARGRGERGCAAQHGEGCFRVEPVVVLADGDQQLARDVGADAVGGDRQANKALNRVVICRLRWDPRTRAYMERRTKDGLSKKEIIRCLKRYVAREIYRIITTNDHERAA